MTEINFKKLMYANRQIEKDRKIKINKKTVEKKVINGLFESNQ